MIQVLNKRLKQTELFVADDQIVSGRIDLGRCMFCGLCMEACGFHIILHDQ
jgi:formate hydrogenlyase subunit 6/NADH:ubiquinone oxidoreductase subunit I